ncbi:MAG: SapC family protein [Glycocaulis sp.]
MADANQGMPEIKGTLPLYKKPEPLNAQAHKGKGLKYGDRPFDFLKDTHFVPLVAGEFAPASGQFPIIFLGETRIPVAVMGLREGTNLYVDPVTGEFDRYAYLPGFVRRYPFVAAVHTEDKQRFTLCVDVDSPLMSDNPDRPFFDDKGQLTPFMQNALDIVQRFETDVLATNQMVAEFRELDLFEEQTTNFQPRDEQGNPVGEPQVIATYWGISMEKVKGLPAAKLSELRDTGALGAIYAHLISIGRWDLIIGRAVARQAQGGATAPMGIAPPPPEA